MPGLDNAWLTSGHFRTGILNAPATAAVLTRWIAAGEPARRARHLGRVPVRHPRRRQSLAEPVGFPDEPPVVGQPLRGNASRSRYSSSGITTRRVLPSAFLASAVVNGCGSPARIPAACSAAPGASTI